MSIITYFENHNLLRRPLNQPRRWPPNQPRRRSGRRSRQNGAVDMRHLDSVLQDLGFAPKPHPTIFTENEPDALFDGLEKFQKANRLTVDGAVENKDSETGRALNKAMAEYFNPSERKQATAGQKSVTDDEQGDEPEEGDFWAIQERIDKLQAQKGALAIEAADLMEEFHNSTNPEHREQIRNALEEIKVDIQVIEERIRILERKLEPRA